MHDQPEYPDIFRHDPVAKAVHDTIVAAGYTTQITTTTQPITATARAPDGHTFVARGRDLYQILCTLAHDCGLELADG